MNREQQIVKARKAGFAAFVGTTIEWYDFYVYATAAAWCSVTSSSHPEPTA